MEREAAVTCDRRLFHRNAVSPTVDRRVRDVDEAERKYLYK